MNDREFITQATTVAKWLRDNDYETTAQNLTSIIGYIKDGPSSFKPKVGQMVLYEGYEGVGETNELAIVIDHSSNGLDIRIFRFNHSDRVWRTASELRAAP